MAQAPKRQELKLASTNKDPRFDTLGYAAYIVEKLVGRAGKDEAAARACTLAFHDVLKLAEEQFEPARVTFYRMRRAVENRYGDDGLPESVFKRAERLKLMGHMHK